MEKRKLIVYWASTALLAFGMLASGMAQLFRSKEMVELLTQLGYPAYLLSILGFWKVLGVIVILLPGFKLVKEWAYAGFFFVMTGALVSHLACHDTDLKGILGPLMQTVFVILSWHFRPASRKLPANLTSA